MTEPLNNYGLAQMLGVSAQMLRDKILFTNNRQNIASLGVIEERLGGIDLNISQAIYIVLSVKNVDNLTRVNVIKSICGIKEEVTAFEKIQEYLPNNENKTDLNIFQNKFGI